MAAFFVGNAATSTSQGIEMDGKIRVNEKLTLGGSYAYLDASYGDYKTAPCTAAQSATGCVAQDLSGEQLPYAPEHSANLNTEYITPISDNFQLSFKADINYTDEVYQQLDNDPIDSQEAFTKINAHLRLTNLSQGWELALIGKNLSDEKTASGSVDLPVLAGGAHVRGLDAPRTLALEFSINW